MTMGEKLSESELADLCAWLDGELDPRRNDEIDKLVESDPAWAQARRQMQSLSDVLDTWTGPEVPAELAHQIASQVRRPAVSRTERFLHWATGVAAAAAIILGLMLHFASPTPQARRHSVVSNQFVEAGRDVFSPAGGGTGSASREAIVFLKMSPEEQQKLLAQYERAAAASAKARRAQARWLGVVLASFTPEQRDQLRRMTPARQAKAFLTRRAELIRAGKLPKPVQKKEREQKRIAP